MHIMCTFGLSGCRVKPRRLRGPAASVARVSHDNQRTPNATYFGHDLLCHVIADNSKRKFQGTGASKHHQNSTRRPPERKKRAKNGGGRRKNTARNFGPPTLRAPTFSGFGPPPLRVPTPSGPHQKQKLAKCGLAKQQKLAKFGQMRLAKCGQLTLAKCGIGQIRFGQMRPNEDGQIRFGQIRPRPKFWAHPPGPHHNTHQIQKWIGQNRIGRNWIGQNWSNQDGQNGIGQNGSLPARGHVVSGMVVEQLFQTPLDGVVMLHRANTREDSGCNMRRK